MRTVENILCPIDVELPAEAALRYAFYLAEAFHASLDVVHARATPNWMPAPSSSPETGQRAEHATSEGVALARLAALVRRVATAVPGRAAAHVVEGGPLSGVLRSALRLRSDLIVVGSSFASGNDWLFGANISEKIAYGAACPVLSVPERAVPSALQMRRILLPVALGRSAALAVQWTAIFARRFGASVELLRVRRELDDDSNALPAGAESDELHEMLRVAGVNVEDRAGVNGGAFEQIMDRIQSSGCDFVVMAAEPRGKRMGVTQPSLIATVCRHAAIPVLSVRAPGAEPARARRDAAGDDNDNDALVP